MRRLALAAVALSACVAAQVGGISEDGGTGGGSADGGGVAAGGGSAGGGAATGGGAAMGGGSAIGGGGGGTTDGGLPDGGTMDSGTPDSGTTDGGNFSTDRNVFFGASRCTGSGFALCEDFEAPNISNQTWSKNNAGNLNVDTADHARGSRALHITQTGNGSSYISTTKPFPATNNTYYGRAFFKFIQLPQAAMGYAHWTIIAGSGTVVDGEIRVSGQENNGTSLFGVGTDNRTQDAGTGDWTQSDNDPAGAPNPVPLNQWICIEWLHDGQNNETRFWWDDVEHPSMHTTSSMNGGNGNPFILPQFNQVWIGWAEYQTSTEPFELWVDEIAIDPQRIGCVR